MNTEALKELLSRNFPLHVIIENEAEKIGFGQITFVMEVREGKVQLPTLHIYRSKRKKYVLDKNLKKE